MRFFLIHGAYGGPNENWLPWLAEKLRSYGHEVIVPQFPTPQDQILQNWMSVFSPYLDKVDQDTVFVGHSLGVAFTLSVLEKARIRVRACFLVAGFVGSLNNPHFDPINQSFTNKSFNWNTIRGSAKEFYLFYSENDPYVPLQKGRELAGHLHVPLLVHKNAAHFNASAGFSTFPALLKRIQLIT